MMVHAKMLNPIVASPKFKAIGTKFGKDAVFTILDVGCGNHSPSITKRYFKKCRYFGLDMRVYNNSEEDFGIMEKFYLADLQKDDLSSLPDSFFDAIIMSHVIEHIPNGLEVIARLVRKLKGAGIIYIEFPSRRSLSLPSMPGTLRFDDDKTHVKVYDLAEVVSTLRAHGMMIVKAGPRRDLAKALLTPFSYLYLRYVKRAEYAVAFWDILGFADCVLAQRK